MGADSLLVRAFWADRQELLDECARHGEQLFARLAEQDEVFRCWKRAGASPKAPYMPFEPTFEMLRSSLERGRDVKDDLGFSTVVPNGTPGAEDVRVQLFCGAYPHVANPALPRSSLATPNSCLLYLPSTGPHADRLLRVDRLAAIMQAVVTSWDPDWACLSSEKLMEVLPNEPTRRDMAGWLTYLSQRYGGMPALPAGFAATEIVGFGTVVTMVTDELLTLSSTGQVAAIRTLANVLDEAGLSRDTPDSPVVT